MLYPTDHDLLRRELDSRLLASSVHDRNFMPPSLSIPPPSGPLTPIPTPTPFNHNSSSPRLTTSSSSTTMNSSPYLSTNSTSLYPLSSNLVSKQCHYWMQTYFNIVFFPVFALYAWSEYSNQAKCPLQYAFDSGSSSRFCSYLHFIETILVVFANPVET